MAKYLNQRQETALRQFRDNYKVLHHPPTEASREAHEIIFDNKASITMDLAGDIFAVTVLKGKRHLYHLG